MSAVLIAINNNFNFSQNYVDLASQMSFMA